MKSLVILDLVNELSESEKGWIAGILDGEGYISIKTNKHTQ